MNKSSLLINEPPLQVLPSLAVAIGLNEAIVIQQLHYWLNNPKTGVDRDGYKWIFNTYQEWQENFPFWSTSTIQRIFSTLEESGLIISEQLDKKSHDMTKFYRLNYDKLCEMHHVKLESSKVSERHDVNSITETTTENNHKPLSIENAIYADLPVTEDMVSRENLRDIAPRMFEKALGFSRRLPWWDGDKEWRELGEWVCAEYQNDKTSFGRFNTWRNTKYTKGGITNQRLRGFPAEFSDSWDMFKMSEKSEPVEMVEYL